MSMAKLWHGVKRLRMSRLFAVAGFLVLVGMLAASAFGPAGPAVEQGNSQAGGQLEIVSLVEALGKVGQETLTRANQVALASSSDVLGSQTQTPAGMPPSTGTAPSTNMPMINGEPGHQTGGTQPVPTTPPTSVPPSTDPSGPVHTPICGGCGTHKYQTGHYFCAQYCRDQVN